jgi:hypothetical protein
MNNKKTDAANVGSYQTIIATKQLLGFDALNSATNTNKLQAELMFTKRGNRI